MKGPTSENIEHSITGLEGQVRDLEKFSEKLLDEYMEVLFMISLTKRTIKKKKSKNTSNVFKL